MVSYLKEHVHDKQLYCGAVYNQMILELQMEWLVHSFCARINEHVQTVWFDCLSFGVVWLLYELF